MKSRRALYVLLLMVVGGIAACDTSEQFGNLTAPVTPQFSNNGNSNKETPRFVKRNREVATGEVCSDKIAKGGGTLTFDGGSLEITKNAVSTPTIFCATNIGTNGEIKLALRAFENGNGRAVTQFKSIVRLTVDLSDADVTDWNGLKVVWHNYSGGSLDGMPTSGDKTGKKVTANLSHFSDYSVVEPKDPTPILD